MKALVQRVNYSKLEIEGKIYSSIDKGILVLLGVEKGDSDKEVEYIANKIVNLRIFEDANEKMNLSVKDIDGKIMLVSQFTLCADTSSGNRPSYTNAETPIIANKIYQNVIKQIQSLGIQVVTGKFGEHMKINFENDGPVTILLESKK